jgi:hypothetical protein
MRVSTNLRVNSCGTALTGELKRVFLSTALAFHYCDGVFEFQKSHDWPDSYGPTVECWMSIYGREFLETLGPLVHCELVQ